MGKNKIDKEFLIYLIGFFEGDGSLLMNYQRKSIEFTLDQDSKDFAFLTNLRKSLGYGRVLKYKNGSMGRLFIGNEENLLRVIHLLNGNLCIPARREQFRKFLLMYNEKYKTKILFKNYGPKVSLDPSWYGYEFYVGNKKSRVDLIRYFQRYKLKTKKRIAFLTWRNAHDLMVKKVHLTVEGYKTLEGL